MREITTATDAIWLSGDYTGANRPMVRATIQHPACDLYDLTYNIYASLLFGTTGITTPQELPNIKSFKWTRGVDTDIGTGTMELYNTAPQPIGTTFDPQWGVDQPGYYSYVIGDNAAQTDPVRKAWQKLIVPDNLIRSYEGYGFNPTAAPEEDTQLYLTGLWLIKDVEYTAQGLITVAVEDLASILRDQICFYPVIPKNFYPLQFSSVPKTSGYTQGKIVTKLVDTGGNYDPNYPPPDGWLGPTVAPTAVVVTTASDTVHVTWTDVPTPPTGYEVTGYQIVVDNVRLGQVYAVGAGSASFTPGPFVNGNVYWLTVVAIYARLSDGYEQISDHSAGVFVQPHASGFDGAVANIALNDVA